MGESEFRNALHGVTEMKRQPRGGQGGGGAALIFNIPGRSGHSARRLRW